MEDREYYNVDMFILLYYSNCYTWLMRQQKCHNNTNCLFHAVLYCMCNTEDRHSEIRLTTMTKIINELVYYKDFYRGSSNS